MNNIEQTIDQLWNSGFRESDIAAELGISQFAVLFCRKGKVAQVAPARVGTETRFATTFGRGGSTACRRIAVTLPYSGTLAAWPRHSPFFLKH